jgi:hypothetical protein
VIGNDPPRFLWTESCHLSHTIYYTRIRVLTPPLNHHVRCYFPTSTEDDSSSGVIDGKRVQFPRGRATVSGDETQQDEPLVADSLGRRWREGSFHTNEDDPTTSSHASIRQRPTRLQKNIIPFISWGWVHLTGVNQNA